MTDAGAPTRTVLVTFLGSVVRPMGSWLPIGGTVELMTQLGLDATSVRTAVFRLKKRDWLASESRHGVRGYALTPVALAALTAGDEVIWHARQPAHLDDGWCVVNFSVPESQRGKRDQLRSHLSSLGFGNAGTAMWIAPGRMRPSAERAIAELGLTDFSAVFAGHYVAGQDLHELVRRSWDLAGIDRRYAEFLDRFGTGPTPPAAVDGREAFVAYLGLVDHWRKLPFRDPGLPRELLPDDWRAAEAAHLFERLVEHLEARALAHAAQRWPRRRPG